MSPEQTTPKSSLILVHIVYNILYLIGEADERTDDNSHDWREKVKAINCSEVDHLFSHRKVLKFVYMSRIQINDVLLFCW